MRRDNATSFSPDYGTARRRFRDAVTRGGWSLTAHPIEAAGPDLEPLTIDVGMSPAPPGAPVLILSSGLHGVEGFFGSAVQCHLLETWWPREAVPGPVRLVFVHALNPFGFAWIRRADAGNVDLNRNFLLETQAWAGAPVAYAELDALLNPPHAPAADLFAVRVVGAALRHGVGTLSQAVVGGQYEYPRGVFFGGHAASETMRLLAAQLPEWISEARRVLHLDLHTGLGPHGRCTLLADDPPDDSQLSRLTGWCGDLAVRSFSTRRAVSYGARGGFGRWCLSRALGVEYTFAYAEFGTYSALRVLRGLREENQAHHWCAPGDPARALSKARLNELFCPASPRWRQTALDGATELIEGAVRRLSRRS